MLINKSLKSRHIFKIDFKRKTDKISSSLQNGALTWGYSFVCNDCGSIAWAGTSPDINPKKITSP